MSIPTYGTLEYIRRLEAIITNLWPAAVGEENKLRLYKNDVSPDANQTADTFVEADFDGYAAVTAKLTAPTMNDVGMVIAKSNLCNFDSAAGVDPQTVYGIFITNNDGSVVIAAQRFDDPQQMGGALPQAVSGVFRTSEPLSSLGWIDVEN